MKRNVMKGLALALAVMGVLALSSQRSMAAEAMDIDAKIAAAKTAADHEAIAAYYDGEAAEAKQKADEHKKMGDEYKKGIAAHSKFHFGEHCTSLARMYAGAAKEYAALAASHREMAKHAK